MSSLNLPKCQPNMGAGGNGSYAQKTDICSSSNGFKNVNRQSKAVQDSGGGARGKVQPFQQQYQQQKSRQYKNGNGILGVFGQQNGHSYSTSPHHHNSSNSYPKNVHSGFVVNQNQVKVLPNGKLGSTNLGALLNGLMLNQKKNGIGNGAADYRGQKKVHRSQAQPSPEELTVRLNTEALQRIDPCFIHLYGSASQVAVYDFDAVTNYWTDTKTVGCLFLYSRSQNPKYGLVVLNRKGLENLEMHIDKDSQVIPHEPYLLLRQGPNEAVKCIWFYKNSEFYTAVELLKKMGIQFDQIDTATNNQPLTRGLVEEKPESAKGNNLMDMLKKSQDKLDDSISGQKIITAEILEQQMLDEAQAMESNASTETFLCIKERSSCTTYLAGSEGKKHVGLLQSLDISESGASLMKKFSSITTHNPPASTDGDSEAKSVVSEDSVSPRTSGSTSSFQMRTVEQLEKEFVPVDLQAPVSKKKETLKKGNDSDISKELLATLGINPIKQQRDEFKSRPPGGSVQTDSDVNIGSDEYSPKSSSFMTPASGSRSESCRSIKKLTIDDLDGKLYDETDEDMVREVVESLADLTELLLLSENVEGQSEPQLVWRKRSNLQNRPASALIRHPHPATPNRKAESKITSAPDFNPLTRNQLLQAIGYLLETDTAFVDKIHEAYVKSLQPRWACNPFAAT